MIVMEHDKTWFSFSFGLEMTHYDKQFERIWLLY